MPTEELPKPSVKKMWAFRIISAMFGMPMALNVLSKLDDRLDFSPLLERAVLGFDVVSEALWSIVSTYIRIDLSEYHSLLTLVMILGCAYISRKAQSTLLATQEYSSTERSLETTCFFLLANAFIFSYLKTFGLEVLILFIMIMYVWTSEMKIKSEAKGGVAAWVRSSIKSVAPFGAVFLGLVFVDFVFISNDESYLTVLLLYFHLDMGTLSISDDPSRIVIVGVALLAVQVAQECWLAISYGGLWVVGILSINWVSVRGRPAVESFLDGIGA